MEAEHKKYLASVKAKVSASKMNALAMAAPLESTPNSNAAKTHQSTSTETKKAEKEVPNQKIGILHALLSIGALRPALAFLNKFPWAVDASPDIADLMLRILKHSIGSLYDSSWNAKEPKTSFAVPKARFGASSVVAASERKPQLTVWAPTPPPTATINFVFFFPEWTERIPVCTTLEDLIDVTAPLMKFIGLHVSRDTIFLHKFLRLARIHLQSTV
jgi:THO complex subunit 2